MANTVTLAQLRTRSSQRADMENSEFVSPEELLSYINASYAELHDILVSKFEDYYTISSLFSIASGNTSPLPTDFYKLRGVDFKVDANNWISVSKFNFANRNTISRSSVSRSNKSAQYRVIGDNLMIEPESSAVGDYRIWYTPVYTPLVLETDTVNGLNSFEEYIVIDVAIKMLAKEESSVTHLVKEKEAMGRRIDLMAQNRDSGQPEKITDTSSYDYNFGDRIF